MAELLGIVGILSNFATVADISYRAIDKFIADIQSWRQRHKSWDNMMSKFTEYLNVGLVPRIARSF
jgi:hypothetical protein